MKPEDTKAELSEQELDQVTGGVSDALTGLVMVRLIKAGVHPYAVAGMGKLMADSATIGDAMRTALDDDKFHQYCYIVRDSKDMDKIRNVMLDTLYPDKK